MTTTATHFIVLLAVACGAGACTHHSLAATPAPLRVCADPNNLPFTNDKREGFENRLAELLARDLGTSVEYTWWAQRRGFLRNTLDAGRCDVVMGLPTRIEMALTTRPYYRSTWVWHVPALYELAVRNEGVHAVQHAMFVGTSSLFWWGLVYGRYRRTGYGASVFYVFTTAVHTGILGALFTLGTSPFYQVYIERAPDSLGDQQLAGLVMWIPAGLVLTVAGIGLFAAWLGEAERRTHLTYKMDAYEIDVRRPDL